MPNWSDTQIEMTGKAEVIEKIAENFKKHGFNWGATKMPSVFAAYSLPVTVVSDAEWAEVAKELRAKKGKRLFAAGQVSMS